MISGGVHYQPRFLQEYMYSLTIRLAGPGVLSLAMYTVVTLRRRSELLPGHGGVELINLLARTTRLISDVWPRSRHLQFVQLHFHSFGLLVESEQDNDQQLDGLRLVESKQGPEWERRDGSIDPVSFSLCG
jgi:hypothetical protein